MTRDIIEAALNSFIDKNYQDKDGIKSFLLNHERKGVCISNLEKELKMVALRKPRLLKSNENIRTIIESFTKTFCDLAIRHKDISDMTDSQRCQYIRDAEKAEEIKMMAETFTDRSRIIY